jgi:hypothetical protein
MQNNIVHKLPNAPEANESMKEPEVFRCIVCRCFQNSFGVNASDVSPVYFGRYIYPVNMQVPDYPHLNIATVCQDCHWKVTNRTNHECVGCERDDHGSCKKIMEHLQSCDWVVCVNPRCRYCFMTV